MHGWKCLACTQNFSAPKERDTVREIINTHTQSTAWGKESVQYFHEMVPQITNAETWQ